MDQLPVTPTWRKPAGIGLILLLIAGWSILVVALAERIGAMPWPVAALYFAFAGIAWIIPLKPLIRWTQTGKWRDGSGGDD